ncbi:helix-turn-helix domain-containing protein [Brucella sp. JSBI001]|uniref:helix-turn-helix domain-containing protein n=1 Tax=Brucella sp. JSBI001 TaxID=2886044 RepID=UPI002230B2F1|nr:helix-turn-helix domain-containing protein [Brucella sp. JSBI001]UZD70901.1 helix-turn-helix domain-containing protein [Brucella sp. JSBI001]
MEGIFSPATLAKRWECSEKHVRHLIKSGELKAFRLGGKLYRIKQSEVEAFESRDVEIASEPGEKLVERLDPLARVTLSNLRRGQQQR